MVYISMQVAMSFFAVSMSRLALGASGRCATPCAQTGSIDSTGREECADAVPTSDASTDAAYQREHPGHEAGEVVHPMVEPRAFLVSNVGDGPLRTAASLLQQLLVQACDRTRSAASRHGAAGKGTG